MKRAPMAKTGKRRRRREEQWGDEGGKEWRQPGRHLLAGTSPIERGVTALARTRRYAQESRGGGDNAVGWTERPHRRQ